MTFWKCSGKMKPDKNGHEEEMCTGESSPLCRLNRPQDEMDPSGCIHNWGEVVWTKTSE